jgi:putative flippase GtrA
MRGLASRFLQSGLGRLTRFAAVGGATAVVQLAMLFLFKSAGLASVPAYGLGLIVSCQFNFTFNVLLVWHDRGLLASGLRGLGRSWVSYHGLIALALGLNFSIFSVAQLWLPILVAGVAAIAGSTLIKFFSLDRLAFKGNDTPVY